MDDGQWRELSERLFALRRFGMEPGLERIQIALRDETGANPPQVITVAGTNGKGTVASLVAALLQYRGVKVGLYTSPHLVDVRERFRVNGQALPRESVGPVLKRLMDAEGRSEVRERGLTFFEVTTVAAWALFQEAGVEVVVMEVGLGGRLDGVNGLDADLAVVTTIDRDHTGILGETIEEIALEKAGVFRQGRPVVVGFQEHEVAAEALRERALELACPLLEVHEGSQDLVVRHGAAARKAVEALTGQPVEAGEWEEARRQWRWPGRGETWELSPGLRAYVDGAHNPAGVMALRSTLKGLPTVGAVVWGAMGDKELDGVRELFMELAVPVWGVEIENDRALRARGLVEVIPEEFLAGVGPTSQVLSALAEEALQKDGGRRLLIFGSLFLLGEVLAWSGQGADDLWTFR